MLCVSINFRAFSAVQEESGQNVFLSNKIQNLMDENLALQEEIHLLKTDPGMIEREARRLGIQVNSEKVPVPAN
jgi:cell division protein FtsB